MDLEPVASRDQVPGARGPLRRMRALLEDGFTLLELIVTMAILLTVIAALTDVLVQSSNSELDANRRFQVQEQARLGLDKLRRELHCASSVTVVDGGGNTLGAGVSGSTIYATLTSVCPTSGLTSPDQFAYVTWCTLPSGLESGDYALYRVSSLTSQPACSTSGVKWADYLTTATPFCLPDTSNACDGVLKPATSLPALHVTLPLNLGGPSAPTGSYNLVDDIVLRNSTRS